jgi:Phosphotransferase enzyme family
MPRRDHPEFSVEWLAQVFDIGRPRVAIHAGCGQKNPLGVLRFETSQGCFAVKRFEHEPRRGALAIEFTAYTAGFPMPRPLQTPEGKPYATYLRAGSPVWVRVYAWVEGTAYDWGAVAPQLSSHMGALLAALHALPVPAEALREDPWRPLRWSGWEQLAAHATAQGVAWAQKLRQKLPVLVAWEDHVLAYTVSDEPVVPSQRDLHPPMSYNASTAAIWWWIGMRLARSMRAKRWHNTSSCGPRRQSSRLRKRPCRRPSMAIGKLAGTLSRAASWI